MNCKLLGFLIFALVILACEGRRDVTGYLTGGSTKYWETVKGYQSRRISGDVYNSNGTYLRFYGGSTSRTRQNVFFSTTWKLIGDSVLHLTGQGIKLKIEYINDDVMILNNLETPEVIVFKASKDQTSELSPDTTVYKYPTY